MKKQKECACCGKKPLKKDEVAASKKFLGENQFFCIVCLAELTGFAADELEDKIRELKNSGCQYFS